MEGEEMPRIGCIGSKTKWRAFAKSAKSAGAHAQKIDDVRCPIGVPIDAVTVEEIAFSVCSEIIHIMRSDP
jgi:xanthine dehydrogenase accessory factor